MYRQVWVREEDVVKALGIIWEPGTDQLRFYYDILLCEQQCTRRTILSSIAKLFDPLGWISTVIIVAKMLLQELALLNTHWDTPVPLDIERKWKAFHSRAYTYERRINLETLGLSYLHRPQMETQETVSIS